MLEKHRALANDPAIKERRGARALIEEARTTRASERAGAEIARRVQEAQDAQKALEAENALERQRLEAALALEAQEAERLVTRRPRQRAKGCCSSSMR